MVCLTEREGYERKSSSAVAFPNLFPFQSCAPCVNCQFPVLALLSMSNDELNTHTSHERVSSRRTGQLESPVSLRCKEKI